MQITVGLAFPGELKDESVICYLCKNFDVKVNILEASFSISSGWAILGIEGKKETVDEVLQYLLSRGIKINKVGQKQ